MILQTDGWTRGKEGGSQYPRFFFKKNMGMIMKMIHPIPSLIKSNLVEIK